MEIILFFKYFIRLTIIHKW